MSDFFTMYSRIADDLNRDDLNTQIKKAINRSINHYSTESFWFNETTGTVTTVSGTRVYATNSGALPSNIRNIIDAQLANGTTRYTLLPELIDASNYNEPTNTRGIPGWYAWFSGSLYLRPTPNAVYTITLYYTKSYSDLSADSDQNDFTNYAEDLIEYRSLAWLSARLLKNFEEANYYRGLEAEALAELRRQSVMKQSTGRLRSSESVYGQY